MKYQQLENSANILLLNEDSLMQKSLYEMLCRSGHTVDAVDSLEDALINLADNPHQIILTDTNKAGLKLLKIVKKRGYPCQVIILTSYGNIESAVDSIKTGVFDYLVSPVEDKKILSTIADALADMPALAKERIPTKSPAEKDKPYHGLVGKSPQMRDIYSIIERIAETKATVLLRGESGTGKRLIAQAIHKADKKRKDKPFVEISCGALPKEIIESELFGHMYSGT